MFEPTLRIARRSSTLVRRSARRRRPSNPNFNVLSLDWLQFSLGLEPLFQHARDALVVGDLESGCIRCWNRAAEDLFGYSAADAIGRPFDMLMTPAVARLNRERVALYLRRGEALSGRGTLGVPALTKAGEEIRVELSLWPLEVPGGSERLILLNFRDARGDKQLELQALEVARAESARREVEQRLRRCEQMWQESTRELASQLERTRRTAARLAERAASPGETPQHQLALLAQVVEGRTDDLQRTLERIADTLAIETGTFELADERVNLVPLLNRLVVTARMRTRVHRLNFGAPQGLSAYCDPRRIAAVVDDIIERAIRRNVRGCWIDVDLRRPLAGTARIEVRDYGRPVSPAEREQLTQLSSADHSWFVSRYIVERHGGTLELDFPTEGGLRVVLSLPTHRTRLAI
jgi:PAS domain S-box-containing protein